MHTQRGLLVIRAAVINSSLGHGINQNSLSLIVKSDFSTATKSSKDFSKFSNLISDILIWKMAGDNESYSTDKYDNKRVGVKYHMERL